eukprot:1163842-Prorocentrum_minimum.AAC.1
MFSRRTRRAQVKLARAGVAVRPKSSQYRHNLASALSIAVGAGVVEKKKGLEEAVASLEKSFTLEGKPEWDDTRGTYVDGASGREPPLLSFSVGALSNTLNEQERERVVTNERERERVVTNERERER